MFLSRSLPMRPILHRLPMPRLLLSLSLFAAAAVAILAAAYPVYAQSNSACAAGGAVADAASNPELAADCDALLAARANMQGGGELNWAADLPLEEWDGVTVADPGGCRTR